MQTENVLMKHREPLLPRSFVLLLAAILGFTITFMALEQSQQAQAWYDAGTAPAVPGSDMNIQWPVVKVDNQGWVHVAWEHNMGSYLIPKYIRGKLDASGTIVTWEAPQSFDTEIRNHTLRIDTDPYGNVHVIFVSTDNRGYYFYNTNRGAAGSWNYEFFPLAQKSAWQTALAVDDAGVPYVAWGYEVGDDKSEILFAYRTGPNTWTDSFNISGGKYHLARKVSMDSFGSGASLVLHIFYEVQYESNGDFRIFYTRIAANQTPVVGDFTTSLGMAAGDKAAVGVDPYTGMVAVAFDFQAADSSYQSLIGLSYDHGANWSTGVLNYDSSPDVWTLMTNFSLGNYIVRYANVVYDKSEGFQHIYTQSYDAANVVYSEAKQLDNGGNNNAPWISMGVGGSVAVWTKGWTDNVMYSVDSYGLSGTTPPPTTPVAPTPTSTTAPAAPTPTSTPNPPPTGQAPSGRLMIEDGATVISDTQTFITLMLDAGEAHQYKIWNEQDSEPPAFIALPEPLTAGSHWVESPWNLDVPGDDQHCHTVRVAGKFRNTSGGGDSATVVDDINVDTGVDANVQAQNPGDGAPDYTPGLYYMLRVRATPEECSLIREVRAGERAPTTSTMQLASADLHTREPLIMPLVPGPSADHTIVIEVTDGAGNIQTYTRTITLDTVSPTIAPTGTLTAAGATDQERETTLVDLLFENIVATDNLYGQKAHEERPFWGVSIANSREPITLSDTAKLDALTWTALEVTDATASTGTNGDTYEFTINDWNLFEGLDESQQHNGDYYVYARITDGAGHTTTTTLATERISVQLPSQNTNVYLPLVAKS